MDALPWIDVTVRQPGKPLLTKREVCDYLEFGSEALEALMEKGLFPRAIEISPKTLRWRAEWVRWFLESRELAPRLIPTDGVEGFSTVLGGIGPDSTVSGGKRRSGKEEH